MKRPILRWKAIASILFFSFFVTTISLPAAAQLAASPTGMNFGTVQVGTRASLSGVLTNADTDNVTISRVSVSGSAFSMSGVTLPLTLAPGQSAPFTATFLPTATGAVSGSIDVTAKTPMYPKHWRGTLRASVALAGAGGSTAAGQLTANPRSLAFGSVAMGSTSTQNQTVTNSGSASLNISNAAISSAAFMASGLTLRKLLHPAKA